MTYADNRDLRHRLYMAYNTKCTHDNEFNNIDIVKKIANTRMKIAQLLGYKDYAEYTLKRRMAENSRAVYKLLNQLLEAYTPTAEAEYKDGLPSPSWETCRCLDDKLQRTMDR